MATSQPGSSRASVESVGGVEDNEAERSRQVNHILLAGSSSGPCAPRLRHMTRLAFRMRLRRIGYSVVLKVGMVGDSQIGKTR